MRACVTCVEAIDREDSEDEDAEVGYIRNHERQESGQSNNPGLGIWSEEGDEGGSDDEGTVKGVGSDDGEALGAGREDEEP
jgi:hypothetical protein